VVTSAGKDVDHDAAHCSLPAGRHALYQANGYSAAIRFGDLLFVSGPETREPNSSATLRNLKNLEANPRCNPTSIEHAISPGKSAM
jgi:hypothetical protein